MKQATRLPKPTEAELELLRVLWERGPSTVREIFDTVNQHRSTGYTTVLKLMQIMTDKGLVDRDETERAHVYRPSTTQEAMQTQIIRDLSERLFSGSAAQLALHALAMEPATAEELREIRKLIESKRKEKP